ncbi:TerD family protein [Streptomyces sp. NPDC093707]|uniref:TerD family protein n=1 Tax=Streptomyces sp. NPDC093707 TaxID=3154984 RepID=UPI00344BCBF9
MNTFNKGIEKIVVALGWDPSPIGEPDTDLDIIAATYPADAPHGDPAYLVHFDSRSPDGTITLNRDSRTGQGFGDDEVMTLELGRLSERYSRVMVGVVIQQAHGRKVFGEVEGTLIEVREGYDKLARVDFSEVEDATAATVAEFIRDAAGEWRFQPALRGFDADPETFTRLMGA